MKKSLVLIIILISFLGAAQAQIKTPAFKEGEWLRFRMSYGGFLKAGNATLVVDEAEINGKQVFHATGKGWTTGLVKWFFKVDDNYQSYFDKQTLKPYLFKRNVYEGGYRINRQINFDYSVNKATIQDFKRQTTQSVSITDVQDMISMFYFLRNQDYSTLKDGDEISMTMFVDAETYPFKLRLLGREILSTPFGKVKTMRFRPVVQSGRVFEANESVTIWITADKNKIPIKLRASLAVGSLQAELEAYKGLANSFEVIYD